VGKITIGINDFGTTTTAYPSTFWYPIPFFLQPMRCKLYKTAFPCQIWWVLRVRSE
jgi:hypothetical protein